MRLERLEIRGVRLAGPQPRALDLRPGSNVALLLGDNACGKTTFLDAAAYALDAFVSGMTGSPLRRIHRLRR